MGLDYATRSYATLSAGRDDLPIFSTAMLGLGLHHDDIEALLAVGAINRRSLESKRHLLHLLNGGAHGCIFDAVVEFAWVGFKVEEFAWCAAANLAGQTVAVVPHGRVGVDAGAKPFPPDVLPFQSRQE